LGCHGSFWLLYDQHIIYKSCQWVICFFGNYNVGDVIICDFHRPFVIWCMHFVNICTSTNSMIVHHFVNINVMYIYSVMLSLTIFVYVIYLYRPQNSRLATNFKSSYAIVHNIKSVIKNLRYELRSLYTILRVTI